MGKPQPGDEQRAQRIVATARSVVAHYSDVNAALRDGYRPFHPTGKLGEEVHYTNYRYNRLEQRTVNYVIRGRSCTSARPKACRPWASCTPPRKVRRRNI
jgi:hypothetical protein